MCLRCCGCTLPGFTRWRYFVDMWVAEGHTARWPLALCAVCASRRCAGVDRRRACPHRRDVGPWYTAGVNGVATVVGTMVLRGCVCVWQSRSSDPQSIGSVKFGKMKVRFGGSPWRMCVVAVIGCCDRRVDATWRHTPVIHDDPDLRPNRRSFTLTGPSPILRCWFGKGTPLIAAKPLSWVSPCLTSCCLTSCCLCRVA